MDDTDPRGCWTMSVPRPGPPDVLEWRRGEVIEPCETDVIIRQHAIGLNYHDVYVRSGAYRTMPFPGVPGIEAVGTVEWTGAGVTGFAAGDHVGYVTPRYGAYATRRAVRANELVPVPPGISFDVAAAALLKGLTADMLLSRLHDLGREPVVVVHAAAGGVGQILTQMAMARGATVVAAVGTAAKAELVRSLGCESVTVYDDRRLVALVLEVSGGRGADMVFDGVGAATFDESLQCLNVFGQLALFGQASGPVAPIDPGRLAAKSLAVWRPVVFHHASDLARYRASATNVFDAISSGRLVVRPPTSYPLRDAARAHALLEEGTTAGSIVLVP